MTNRVAKAIISVIFLAGYTCYSAICRALGKRPLSTLSVLTYHSITRDHLPRFVRQMDMLQKYHPVFPDETIDLTTGQHYAAVTFDDGFDCVVENALPELIKRNIPATLFIPSGYLGQRPGWIENQNNNNYSEPVMTIQRLQSFNTALIKIGSHSVHHRSLTQLQEEEALKELADSKKHLESLLKIKITSFSFPYGAYNDTTLKLAEHTGYAHVFCSWPIFPPSKINGFLIGRTPASPDDTALEFRLKLMGAYQWLPIGITMKRHLLKVLKSQRSFYRKNHGLRRAL